MTAFYCIHALLHNFTWWSKWTRELQVGWQVVGEPRKNQCEFGEPMKSQCEWGEPPKKGMNFVDSRGEPISPKKKLVGGSDPGGCCINHLSYSKNYYWSFMQIISGCYIFFIFSFLVNFKTLDKKEKIAKTWMSQEPKENFVWNQKHAL